MVEYDLTTLAGIGAATVVLLRASRSVPQMKVWLKDKEPAAALLVPMVLGVLSKAGGAFGSMGWADLVVSLVGVGLGAQLGYDKVLKPKKDEKPELEEKDEEKEEPKADA